MAIVDDLTALLAATPGASVIVFADLSTKMVLAHAMRVRLPQEQLDAISHQAVASFAEPLAEPDLGKVNDALVLTSVGVKLFIRSHTDQSDAICLIGDHSVDVDKAATKMRQLLHQLEAQP